MVVMTAFAGVATFFGSAASSTADEYLCPQFNLGYDPVQGLWLYDAMYHHSCDNCFDADFVSYYGNLGAEASCQYQGDCTACIALADTSGIIPPTDVKSGYFTDPKLKIPVKQDFVANPTGHGAPHKGEAKPLGDPMFLKVPVGGPGNDPVYRYLKVFLYQYQPDYAGSQDTALVIVGMGFECEKPQASARLFVGGLKQAVALKRTADGSFEKLPVNNVLSVRCGSAQFLARVENADAWPVATKTEASK